MSESAPTPTDPTDPREDIYNTYASMFGGMDLVVPLDVARNIIDGLTSELATAREERDAAVAKASNLFDGSVVLGADNETLQAELEAARKERDKAKEEFRKAAEWNRLTELELTNLRSLNADLSQDIDSIDMLRDEFRRIKVCSGVTDEIKGLCERALLDIKQKVPVIEQRDAAETQRNAALRDAMDALEEVESLTVQLTSALAAKDAAERLINALESIPKTHAIGLAPSGTWQYFGEKGNAAKPTKTARELLEAIAALTPAPTQEPPAGGVTISTEGRGEHAHELKIWPPYFDAVNSGLKTFEIRKLDRDYRVGDRLHLREWMPETEAYTGRRCCVVVTYITTWEQREGYGVLGIRREPPPMLPTEGSGA